MNFDPRRLWLEGLRHIPLAVVLRTSGALPDRNDPAKWHTARGVLSVNGMKFINWNQGRGGGGAIDLVMHLNATDFRSALQWLAQRFPSAEPSRPPPPAPKLLALPAPSTAQLPGVLRYLRDQRRLPDMLLAPLVRTGQLYADARANAVFLLLGNQDRAVGAELRGTRGDSWRGLAPGSRKDLGYFAAGPPHAQTFVLCESAIDALSCAVLHPLCRCLSTSGARPNPTWLAPLLANARCLYCGFDADPTGDHMAQAMIALHPSIQRLRPPLHDWNDLLQASA